MSFKLHFFLRISAVLFAISAHSQFGNFDDQFTFTGATPSVQSKTTQYGLDCGIQSLTLRWYRVQNEYYYVNSYSLQVRDNGQWKTIRTISKGRSSYSVTINSFENGWNDSEANFNFRVRVNVNLEDVNDGVVRRKEVSSYIKTHDSTPIERVLIPFQMSNKQNGSGVKIFVIKGLRSGS